MCFLFINSILDIQLLLTWGVVRRVFGTSPAPPAGPHQQFAHGPVPVDLSIFSSYAPVPIHADHRSNEKNNKQTKNWWKQNCQYFFVSCCCLKKDPLRLHSLSYTSVRPLFLTPWCRTPPLLQADLCHYPSDLRQVLPLLRLCCA